MKELNDGFFDFQREGPAKINTLLWPNNIVLSWGFTAQSTQWGHVERGQFT